MSFNLETFVSSSLKKADLLVIAHHYELRVSETTTKAQLKESIYKRRNSCQIVLIQRKSAQ